MDYRKFSCCLKWKHARRMLIFVCILYFAMVALAAYTFLFAKHVHPTNKYVEQRVSLTIRHKQARCINAMLCPNTREDVLIHIDKRITYFNVHMRNVEAPPKRGRYSGNSSVTKQPEVCHSCQETHQMKTLLDAFTRAKDVRITVQEDQTTVGIAMAITSKKLLKRKKHKVKASMENRIRKDFPVFKSLLPSFCETATLGYTYRFYIAYDWNDNFFTNADQMNLFVSIFKEIIGKSCSELMVDMTMIKCNFSGSPAWSQNAAAMEAWMDGADFIYRINDDIRMDAKDWTPAFIDILERMQPPFVGVTGPVTAGNARKNIMIFDFVYKTHIDIFGFHYPNDFPDWFGDGWISNVYRPNNSKKTTKVNVTHISTFGMRYRPSRKLEKIKDKVVHREKRILERYINQTHMAPSTSPQQKQGKQMVCMILRQTDNATTRMNILRNMRLFQVLLPTWEVHIFIEAYPATSIHSFRHDIYTQFFLKLYDTNVRVQVLESELSLDNRLMISKNVVIDHESVETLVIWPTNTLITEGLARYLHDFK